jgi:hypothetical protein
MGLGIRRIIILKFRENSFEILLLPLLEEIILPHSADIQEILRLFQVFFVLRYPIEPD